MKSIFAGLLFVVLLVAMPGCTAGRNAAYVANAGKLLALTQEPGPTLTQSAGDHLHSIGTVIDYDRRAIFHDLDLLFQTERPSRLSRWVDP